MLQLSLSKSLPKISSAIRFNTISSSFLGHRNVHNKASKQQEQPSLAIRRETVNLWERRAPLAPSQVRQLVKQRVKVVIQPSNRRAFTDNEYRSAGAIVHEDISDFPVVIGVKQVPIDHKDLLPNKTYAFFSHTIKAQDENMPLLDAILERNIRIIDYEKMLDDKGQRVVAFGQFAGTAGMINILHGLGLRFLALGHHTPFMHIGPAHNYRCVGMARQAIRDAGYEISIGNMPESIGPLTFVFTGSGNVSQGAQEIFRELPVEYVEPEHLKQVATKGARNKVYGCVISRNDHIRRREGGGFDANEFGTHPERYISTFAKEIAPFASVIINGIYYAPNAPRLLSIPDAKHLLDPVSGQLSFTKAIPGCPTLPHRLIGICDISADPGGSIEFMKECTTIDKPFCLYDAEENLSYEKFSGSGVLICSIDNMPAQLPRESTEFFGSLLMPHIPDIIASNAREPFADYNGSPIVKNAVITSNGELTPNFKYIADLRNKKVASKMRMTSHNGHRSVLVFGSGFVVPPLVEHLVKDESIRVTLASNAKTELMSLVDKVPNTTPEILDVVHDHDRTNELIRSHDAVVSVIPYWFHESVMQKCISNKRHLITASYCSPALSELHQSAKDAGITAVMEVGLDPGIDHCLTMECLDDVKENGGSVVSYTSYTGGLPAPECSENPLRYRFSWSPEAALITSINPAKYILNGKIKEINAGGDLMLNSFEMDMLPGFNLTGFPNRDSTVYAKRYGLDTNVCKTLIRGTLRYKGYAEAMWGIIQMGLLSKERHFSLDPNGPDLTWKEFMCDLMGLRKDIFTGTLKDAVFERLGEDLFKFNCLNNLGLFSDHPVDKVGTPLGALSAYLATKLVYAPHERDVIIMSHEVGIQWPNKQSERRDIRMVVYGDGDPKGHLAMAKTVGIPTAISTRMILDGEVQDRGIVLPFNKAMYRPILKRLKQEGIYYTESSHPLLQEN